MSNYAWFCRWRPLFLPAMLSMVIGSLQAQHPYKIKGCLDNNKYQEVYLARIRGAETKIMDTSLVTNGCFDFYLGDSTLPGMYSIILDVKKEAYIRVLFNGENIVFHSDLGHLLDSMTFTESKENMLYYEYSRFTARSNRKIDLLTRLSGLYDHEDKFYKKCREEIDKVNQLTAAEPLNMIARSPGTFFAILLKAQQPIRVPDNLDDGQRKKYYREHYLDNVDLSYTPMIRTDLLPQLLKNYLTFFEQKDFTQTEQELSYLDGIDQLLARCKSNRDMYDFVIRQLLEIFRYGNYDIMGAYITEKFMLSNKCESEANPGNYKMTIENIRRVSVGKTAPEIILKDSLGTGTGKLSEFTDDFILVVFWSTTCSHCTKMLPELSDLYSKCQGNSFEILCFSLDADKNKWKAFLSKGNYKWINYNDPLGWQGNTARDFNVSATPIFFLLNKEKKIIAKPIDMAELTAKLRSLNILK
jgi:hypothetical protein